MNNDFRVEDFCVSINGNLLDALRVIDRDAEGFAVVLDEDNKVYGTLTDGDIRRALLSGDTLESSLRKYACTEYSYVGSKEGRANVLDLMQARSIRQVPVLNEAKSLLGIHFLSQIIGKHKRPNPAVIMAGGKGTRLYPITKDLPKPMVQVAGRPILERLVLHLVSHGIDKIFLSVNHLSHIIEKHFGNGERFGCQIEYLHEDEALGTAGSLSLLPEKPAHPVVVMNGDLVMNADIGAMIDFHESGGYFSTMGVKTYHHEVPFGCVESKDDTIVSIREKPAINLLVNAGIYILSPEAVSSIPKEFLPITNVFEGAVEEGRPCGTFLIEEEWSDVGRIDDLKKAQGEI